MAKENNARPSSVVYLVGPGSLIFPTNNSVSFVFIEELYWRGKEVPGSCLQSLPLLFLPLVVVSVSLLQQLRAGSSERKGKWGPGECVRTNYAGWTEHVVCCEVVHGGALKLRAEISSSEYVFVGPIK